MSCPYMLQLLFFHAEDGLRAYKVTGVQTCALPISRSLLILLQVAGQVAQLVGPAALVRHLPKDGRQRRLDPLAPIGGDQAQGRVLESALPEAGRSEERRVGKTDSSSACCHVHRIQQ